MGTPGRLRIGELSRRVGVSPELLRAWESRYGLVRPQRTPGGLRLYSSEDERRIRRMQENLERGLTASEAARLARTPEPEPAAPGALAEIAAGLRAALDRFDEPAAQAELDRLFGGFALDSVLSEVVLPYLRELGERWERAHATVAQEHFASNLIEGRLWSLARGWDQGGGPRALLACPSGELHDLGLLCFGLVLRSRGWRIVYLGADTPAAEVRTAARAATPSVIVLSATAGERFAEVADDLRRLARRARIAIGGAGANERLAKRVGAKLLDDDAVGAAARLAAEGP